MRKTFQARESGLGWASARFQKKLGLQGGAALAVSAEEELLWPRGGWERKWSGGRGMTVTYLNHGGEKSARELPIDARRWDENDAGGWGREKQQIL